MSYSAEGLSRQVTGPIGAAGGRKGKGVAAWAAERGLATFMSIAYRPEVDGLRAIAVGAVLIYHAGFSVSGQNPLPGGFLGVDIFFVISGYLISSIILRELSAGSFRLLDFYHRRARRILPALFAILLASLICGWFLLTPSALESFSGSALSALFFGANFWFLSEDSYWAAPGALKPLLHTWTLAVEEQFYIFFPLLLMAMWRAGRNKILHVFLLLFAASLILSAIGARNFPDANFFLLPTRAWELLAGALLAWLEMTRGRTAPKGWRKALPAAGLILVLVSFFLFTEKTPHPSFLTVAPVLGVCLVIWFAKQGDIATALLSSKPFVAVGLISYSHYLWHYPAFAYTQIKFGALSNAGALFLLVIVFGVSVLSYFFVEQPLRNRKVISTRIFAPGIAAAFALLAVSSSALYLTDGYAARYGEFAAIFTESGAEDMAQDLDNCEGAACSTDNTEVNRGIIVIGDSHAGVIKHAVAEMAKKYQSGFRARNLGSCVHVDVEHVNFGECDAYRADTSKLVEEADPSIIVYAVHWRKYQDSTRQVKYAGTVTPYEGETLAQAYAKTFGRWLEQGHRLVLIAPGIESETHIQEKVKALLDKTPHAQQELFMNNLKLEVDFDAQVERASHEREMMDVFSTMEGVIVVDPLELFCDKPKKTCALNDGSTLFIRDYTHYSKPGAALIIADAEKKMLKKGWLKPVRRSGKVTGE